MALAVLLALGLLGGRLMLDPLIRSMIYPVPAVPVPPVPPAPLKAVHLELAEGGGVMAWLLEAPESATERSPLVLFFHGNGENLETMRMAGTFQAFHRMGVAVLAVEYPGYGNNPGIPSEPALHASADAALGWARGRHPDRPPVAVGWSLGAAVAVALAARAEQNGEALAGLVALSPWTSLEDVAKRHFPGLLVGLALSERYDSLSLTREIRGLELPTLVAHGAHDQIIPLDHGRRIAEALGSSTHWIEVEHAGHNDLLAGAEVWEALATFLGQVGGRDEPRR